MKLLTKNKGNKSSEYCFNKAFFITVLSMLNTCQHSQQHNVNAGEKTKSKKPNEKTKLKKHN